MKRPILTLIILVIISFISQAQVAPGKYYIQFTDKNNSPYSISNPGEYLSDRAIERRERFNIAIDMKDIPVNPQYIEAVREAGATILNPTKWFNGVTIQTTDPDVLAAIEELPFVVSVLKSSGAPGIVKEKQFFTAESFTNEPGYPSSLKQGAIYNYGPSFNQISMLNGDQMHDLGYRGQGMVIAVLDAGFSNANNLAVFDSLWNNGQILGTHDFVSGGEVTFDKHYHGTMVLSTMGGNYPGEIVGTAPEASYWLLRSEDGATEFIIEEYNWVSAAEFADSAGADIINSSLGYSDFEDPTTSHTYEDMDGNSTPITRGADLAASRGMVVVNSAGNSGGSSWYYITAPADGDSVYGIGAVNWEGIPAGFSGHGPTYDGRVKPNVSAQGEGTYIAEPGGGFTYGNGTSFSSPIIAGMMACLWQANPDMNNMELLDAIQSTASIATAPDDEMGYGIPDFIAANDLLTIIEGNEEEGITNIMAYPNPFTGNLSITLETRESSLVGVLIVDMTGRMVYSEQEFLAQGSNQIKLTSLGSIPSGIYFLRLEIGGNTYTSKIVKQ